ncbi:hypothetical protein ACUN24_09105 [Pedobacter sp. WC2501]
MKTLEVTLEVLETKELSTVAAVVDQCGTASGGDGSTVVYACCCCCC